MRKSIVRNGAKLLLISVIYRIISYIFLSFSWQWTNVFIRAVEFGIGILFLGIWLIYGLKKNAGFRKGLMIGIIGASDAILLIVLSLVLYINRGSYYFGPIEMVIWNVPLLGIINQLRFKSDAIIYVAPFLAILLTAVGSTLGKSKNYGIQKKV